MVLVSLFFIFVFVKKKYQSYFYPPKEQMPYQVSVNYDDTLRIAYIGDSWALGHKNHTCLILKLLEDSLHRPIWVESLGIGGLTSKKIYYSLFYNEHLKNFIKKGYDYCFISAGINDASGKMSIDYYISSMNYIIKFLLGNNIIPIILEIPDYNIKKVFHEENFKNKLIRYFSMAVNGIDIDCKQEYRSALKKLINENYKNKVIIIPYKSWNNKYEYDLEELYLKDGLHLNNKGYMRLDSAIVSEIISRHHYK